jgi:signal transduction histidine kinase
VVFVGSTLLEALTQEDVLLLQLICTRFGGLLQRQAWSAELAQAEADRLAQVERDDFLSSVAHDLKNALTMMRGNAQLAVRRAAKGNTENSEVVFTRIAAKAGQAIQLVNDLIDVSHLETGAFRLVMEPVEVVAWLEEEVAALQATFAEQATITFQTDYAQVTIEADPNRLSQVLGNLVTNAVRYAPPGSLIEVCLTPATSLPDRWDPSPEAGTLPQAIQIIVNDQGLGVTPEERERIFERATRGRGARLAPGSGLGLYISREIIHRHGGQIWVQGRDGPGASFRFTLPRSRTHP